MNDDRCCRINMTKLSLYHSQSNAGIGEITSAIEGEAASIAQVAEGIGQISAVVQSNSASSEESAAVSAELFGQVRMLEAQTNRFRLRGEGGRPGGNARLQ